MRLGRVRSTKALCQWFRDHGLTPGENAHVDHVDRVHTAGSWHYKAGSPGVERADGQGTCAIDLNDVGVSDTRFHRLIRGDWRLFRPRSETEALRFVYFKLKKAQRRHRWPIAEMFFDGLGYKDDTGWGVNRPIGGHDGHLHVGFTRDRW